MRNRHYKVITAIVLSFAFVSNFQAQDSQHSLVLIGHEGYIWSEASGDLLSLPGAAHRGNFSPSGAQIAYRSIPIEFIAGLDALREREGGAGGITEAYDIGIYNLATGETTIIAGQPEDASFFEEGVPLKYSVRSEPVWSPDGTHLAWTTNEAGNDAAGFFIEMYDLNTQTSTIIADGLTQGRMIQYEGPPLLWTTEGISAIYNLMFQQYILTYTPDGSLMSNIDIDITDAELLQIIPVWQGGRQYIAVEDIRNQWSLLDVQSGDIVDANGVPEMLSPYAEDASLSAFALRTADYEQHWYVATSVGKPRQVDFEPQVISPDGNTVAYLEDEAVYLWQDGEIRYISPTGNDGLSIQQVYWGQRVWHIREGVASERPAEEEAQG